MTELYSYFNVISFRLDTLRPKMFQTILRTICLGLQNSHFTIPSMFFARSEPIFDFEVWEWIEAECG